MTTGCIPNKNKKPNLWSPKELSEWFNNGDWKQGWDAEPDESIDQKEFARLYFKNPKRWNKAFHFLKTQNLSELAEGNYELEGTDLFMNVSEYMTRNKQDVLFEAHRKYADIQVVVFGEEEIGVLPLDKTTVSIPYDENDDIIFLKGDEKNFRIARPGNFFIFFPNDAHQPSLKTNKNLMIRKIVIKVRVN